MPLPKVEPVWLIVVSTDGVNEGLFCQTFPNRAPLTEAFRTKREAADELSRAKQLYKHAFLMRFVPVEH